MTTAGSGRGSPTGRVVRLQSSRSLAASDVIFNRRRNSGQRYLVERQVQVHRKRRENYAVLAALGAAVQWKQSYVSADRIYCVYPPVSEMTREHARCGGFPPTR